MKVIALTLTTLCIATVTHANWDYDLQCTRQEVGIRWPSYYSNSDYYICQREGGRQLKNTCPEGQLFTFALQSCTIPKKFIPPPPMNILPTSSPILDTPSSPNIHNPNWPNNLNQNWLPKPIHTQYPDDSRYPTINGNEYPPSVVEPVPHPPILIDEPSYASPQPEDKPLTPPSIVKPQDSASVEQPEVPSELPQPPTPAPTPPVVQPPKKKTPPAPPSATQKKPAAKKPPSKPVSKKNQAETDAKKAPPKPISKTQKAKVEPPKPASKTQQMK